MKNSNFFRGSKKFYSHDDVLKLTSKLEKKMMDLDKNFWDGHNFNHEVYKKLLPELEKIDIELNYWRNVLIEMNKEGILWSCGEIYLEQRFGPIPFTKKYESQKTANENKSNKKISFLVDRGFNKIKEVFGRKV